MTTKQPAMSPSDLPIEPVLDRATGPRRAEVDELLDLHAALTGEPPVVWAGRELLEWSLAETRARWSGA